VPLRCATGSRRMRQCRRRRHQNPIACSKMRIIHRACISTAQPVASSFFIRANQTGATTTTIPHSAAKRRVWDGGLSLGHFFRPATANGIYAHGLIRRLSDSERSLKAGAQNVRVLCLARRRCAGAVAAIARARACAQSYSSETRAKPFVLRVSPRVIATKRSQRGRVGDMTTAHSGAFARRPRWSSVRRIRGRTNIARFNIRGEDLTPADDFVIQ